ncbi:MAG TPA: hypothetical protein VFV02_16940 [Acidimicrobiales bacterium]|nr:hypothetical protein [Acidimicrobiales bacterium]
MTRKSRKLVLVDIENPTATPTPSTKDVALVMERLGCLVLGLKEAHIVVACSHHAPSIVAFAWPGVRHLWKSGPDGADLALLEVLTTERVHERFESITICSGDGIFADVAGWLGTVGVDVTVISLKGHLSTRLRLAARVTHELPIAIAAAHIGEPA